MILSCVFTTDDRSTRMRITNTLIKKFLENRCNADEAAAIARYLQQHPELMAIYSRAMWDAAGDETNVPAGYTEEMWEAINQQMRKDIRTVRFRWFAAAASFLMLVTAVWLYKANTGTAKQTLATTIVKEAAENVQWKQHSNTTAKTYSIKLQDGSVVKLAPKAFIKYQEPFEKDKRTIYMEGEAHFEVAHDKARPFTVNTGLFATTALGTSFRVSENAAGCNIKLFTGKVLIKALGNKLKGWKEDVVLLPGTQMNYDLVKNAFSINQIASAPTQAGKPKDDANADEGKIVFDNTPLVDVIKALKEKYHTPIEYDEALLAGKYFSGEVLKTDPLSLILKVIVNMNELQVTQKDNGYIITKSN